MSRRLLSLVLTIAVLSLGSPGKAASPAAQSPGFLLAGGRLVDGTGAAARYADVLVRDGRVAAIGAPGSVAAGAGTPVVRLDGLVLAPGFIDIHNHSTDRLRRDPAATTQVAQGVTTIVVGADGSSPWPLREYFDSIDDLPPALNVAAMVGHGTIRRAVLGDDYRRAVTAAEVAAMAAMVEEGMQAGAFGLSSGLEYDPGFYSGTDELIELARVAAAHGGFYMSHIRDEEEGVLDAIDEALRIGREARVPVQLSHIKMGNASVWGKASQALSRIAVAREHGHDVTADQYPYTAWQSGLGIVVSSRRYADPEQVREGLAAVGGAERLQITSYEPDPSVNGMRLSEIAERDGVTAVDKYIEMMAAGGAGVIGHTMNDGDVDAFMTSPLVMTASDGGIGSAHPRGAGAFARVLGHYARERELISLERAVQRGTAMPAQRLGLADRGVVREGAVADLVAFDPGTVVDESTFTAPLVAATGVAHTWVAGELVWSGGAVTGSRPGRVLLHPGAR